MGKSTYCILKDAGLQFEYPAPIVAHVPATHANGCGECGDRGPLELSGHQTCSKFTEKACLKLNGRRQRVTEQDTDVLF